MFQEALEQLILLRLGHRIGTCGDFVVLGLLGFVGLEIFFIAGIETC